MQSKSGDGNGYSRPRAGTVEPPVGPHRSPPPWPSSSPAAQLCSSSRLLTKGTSFFPFSIANSLICVYVQCSLSTIKTSNHLFLVEVAPVPICRSGAKVPYHETGTRSGTEPSLVIPISKCNGWGPFSFSVLFRLNSKLFFLYIVYAPN